jgi:hypothetical protein
MRSSHDISLVPMSRYAEIYHPLIEHQLDVARVLVAHGETGVLFGFIAFDPSTYAVSIGRQHTTLTGYVLYCYVAEPFRRRRIASALFATADISPYQRFGYACRTRSSWLLRSKIPLAEYDPFRARYEEVTNHVRSHESAATEVAATDADPRQQDLAP